MKAPSNIRLLSLLVLATVLLASGCSPPALFENEHGMILSALDSDAAIPQGMRRTQNGWEDASNWQISTDFQSRSINSWMAHQRQREPSWVRRMFEEIRTTPPLMIAVIQITAIAAIVHTSRHRPSGQPS